MGSNLKKWIAESESWQSFLEYKVDRENMPDYEFIERSDDMYISLISGFFELINQEDPTKSDTWFSYAKGLEIYSLEIPKRHFSGVNFNKNLLYVATLYYLADYTAIASIIAKLINPQEIGSEIESFNYKLLAKQKSSYYPLSKKLDEFLKTGNPNIFEKISQLVSNGKNNSLAESPEDYFQYRLAEVLTKKFSNDNIWKVLERYSNEEVIKKFIQKMKQDEDPIWTFFPSQIKAIANGFLDEGKTKSLQMPTSAGKTAISELAIYYHVNKHPESKVLFLAPFRALASELRTGFCQRLASLGIKSRAVYGGFVPSAADQEAIEKIDLLVSTPEKFMALETVIPNLIDRFDLIICDEGHLLDSKGRGLSYELLLSKFKAKESHLRRFLFISAIVPNIKDIHKWLGGDDEGLINSRYRPSELRFAFLEPQSKAQYRLEFNPGSEYPINFFVPKFLVQADFQYINESTGRRNTHPFRSFKALAAASALKALNAGAVAIFTTQKNFVAGIIEDLLFQITSLKFKPPLKYANTDETLKLGDYFEKIYGSKFSLTVSTKNGFFFHHGDLPQDTREKIEKYLREGFVKLVVCTNTLAEGVNLPISTLIIHTVKRSDDSGKMRPIPLRDLKNIVGRAGRAGKAVKGTVIAVNPGDFPYLKKVISDDINEPVRGRLSIIVEAIHKFKETCQIELTNELFDKQNEDFLKKMDIIDQSIIDLLDNREVLEGVDDKVSSLSKNTFAYYLLNESQKETLNQVVQLRIQKIKELIQNDDFNGIKMADTSPRLYKKIIEKLNKYDFNSISKIENFDEAHDFYCKFFADMPNVKDALQDFCRSSKNKDALQDFCSSKNVDSLNSLNNFLKSWLEGVWYIDLARSYNLKVDSILSLFSKVLGFEFQILIKTISRITEAELLKRNLPSNRFIIDFPLCVDFGVNTTIKIDLFQLGITDRFAVNKIADLLKADSYEYENTEELKKIIRPISSKILEHCKGSIPEISFNQLESDLKYINQENTF